MVIESFGVVLEVVVADADDRRRVTELLPPGWKPATGEPEHGPFELVRSPEGTFQVAYEGGQVAASPDREMILGVLDAQVRALIALHAPDYVFVHAGVVGVGDRAMLFPGRSFAGKTTLVAALVEAGATYYSDEFAVVDAEGRVHPYAKPLSMRSPGSRTAAERPVESFGGQAGIQPLVVGLIAVTEYVPGATWAPDERSPGEGALALLANTVPAQSRPEQSLAATRLAATGAAVLVGERGEAADTARELLAFLRTHPAGSPRP